MISKNFACVCEAYLQILVKMLHVFFKGDKTNFCILSPTIHQVSYEAGLPQCFVINVDCC